MGYSVRMRSSPVFALIDCNNFFVSCERVFRPDLWGKPVAVLSNNDGCIVARSNEVKALGVPMGVPYFQVKDVLKRNNVTLFSANFGLYGDFSQRVVRILEDACPDIEVYSVDESFLDISRLPITDYETWGRDLRAKILQWTGLPVSVGIASSKTLAKAAADHSKQHDELMGCFSVMGNDQKRIDLLTALPLRAVWGVGRGTAPKLQARGIKNAYDLSQVSEVWAQDNLSIRGVKMLRELNGHSCYGLDTANEPQKSIARTRSFGHNVRNYYELEGAIATFAAHAAQKLRKQGGVAGAVVAFLRGARRAEQRAGGSFVTTLLPPSADTGAIITAALESLQRVYDPDFSYEKGGVILTDLRTHQQLTFDSQPDTIDRKADLMHTVDQLNARYNTRLVRHASEHPENQKWHSKRQLRSPAYTTNWRELRAIKA